MKRLLFGLLALFVLLVAAVLIVPSFINWNTFKPDIVAQVRSATGRDLTIGGDIRLKLLPSPALSVEDARFANIEGAPTPDMATLKSLDVRVRLVPLLTGEIQVESIRLVEPTIVLERLADGRANWQFEQLAGGADGPPLRLDHLAIDNATVIYRNLATNQSFEVTALSLTGSAISATGPFEASGEGRFGDQPLTVEVRTGDFASPRPVPVLAIVGADSDSGSFTISGTVSRAENEPAFAGTIKATAANPTTLLARVGIELQMPPALQGKLDLDGKLEATLALVTANDLTLRLGETQATGAVSVALAETPSIDATLALNRVDLDALLAANTGSDDELVLPVPPAGIQASLNLSIDGIAWRQGVLRQVRLQAALHDGVLTIGQFGTLLPGGSDLQLLGTVEAAEGLPRFDGQVEMSADNLRGLLAWLQIDPTQVPAGRLTNLTLTSRLRATPKLVEVYGLNLRLDASAITGGMAFLIQQRPSFGIDLAVDRLNLDGYLPVSRRDDAPPAALPPLAALDGFDTNFKLKIGKLTYNRMPIDDVNIDLSLVGGTLDLRQATVADLAGASASLAASVSDLGKPAPSIDARLRLLANDVTGLTRLARIELPVRPASLGKADLSVALAGTLARLDVDAVMALGEARLAAKGAVAEATRNPRADLALDFRYPSLAGLAHLLDLPIVPLQGSDSAVAIQATLKGNADEVAVDGTVNAVDAILTSGGRFSDLQATPKVDIAVNLQHADLRGFLRGLGVAYDPALRQLGGLGMSARLTGSEAALDIADLQAVLGPVQIEGAGMLKLDGPRPYLNADLKANQIVADFFLAPMALGGDPAAGGGGVAGVPMPPAGRWSREPIDLTGLGNMDADIKLAATQLSFDRYDFVEPQLTLGVREGVLTIAPLTGRLFDGEVRLTGELTSRPRPALKLDVDLQGADLREALVTAIGQDALSGRFNLTGSFATSGASEWALVSGINGNATVSGGDGAVQGVDMALISARLGELNQLADFVDLMARATAGGETPLRTLSGTWQIRDGIARTDDTVATLEASRAETTGTVNLPTWEIDLDTRLTLTEHPEAPPVGLDLTGPLDEPRREVKTAALQKFVTTRVGETLLRKSLGDGEGKRLDKILDQTLGGDDRKTQQREEFKGLLNDVIKGR